MDKKKDGKFSKKKKAGEKAPHEVPFEGDKKAKGKEKAGNLTAYREYYAVMAASLRENNGGTWEEVSSAQT